MGTIRSTRYRVALPVFLLLIAPVAWRSLFGLQFVGPDAWPYLLQARDALGEPLRLLTEAYLSDVWEGARFWRPGYVALGSLQLTTFGPSPLAFSVVVLAALVALSLLAGELVRVCGGMHAGHASFFASLVVLLHPVQLETLPALARNADLWASIFIVGSMLALARKDRLSSTRLVVAVAAAFAAPLFKETGLVAPLVGMLVLAPWRRTLERRTPVLIAASGLILALAIHVCWRLALLGTLGGYDTVLRDVSIFERLSSLLRGLFDHQGWGWPAGAAGAALLLAAGLTFALAERDAPGALRRRVTVANLLWTATLLVALIASERCRMRHAVALVPPLGIAAGLWLASLGRLRHIPTAVAAGALSCAALLGLLPGSPLYARAEQWNTAGLVSRAVIDASIDAADAAARTQEISTIEAGSILVHAAPSGALLVEPFPYRTAPPLRLYGSVARIDSAMVLMPYSIETALTWHGVRGPVRVEPAGAWWMVSPQALGPDLRSRP